MRSLQPGRQVPTLPPARSPPSPTLTRCDRRAGVSRPRTACVCSVTSLMAGVPVHRRVCGGFIPTPAAPLPDTEKVPSKGGRQQGLPRPSCRTAGTSREPVCGAGTRRGKAGSP